MSWIKFVVEVSEDTVKTRLEEQMFGGLRLILFLNIGCFMQNQPESVLKVKIVTRIKYCIDY